LKRVKRVLQAYKNVELREISLKSRLKYNIHCLDHVEIGNPNETKMA
jgi:hypothetical protein